MLRKGGSAIDAAIATADGAQPGRAAILGARRRRLHALLGRDRQRRSRAMTAARPRLPPPRPNSSSTARASRCRARRDPQRLVDRRARRARRARTDARQIRQASLGRAVPAGDRARPRRLSGFAAPRHGTVPTCDPQPSPRKRAPISSMRRDGPGRSGYKLKNPALADTLALIARDGTKPFYDGDIAADIAKAVQHDPRQPGTSDRAGSRQLPRQGARAGLRALSRLSRLRRGSAVVRRRRGRRGARPARRHSISAPRRST